MWRVSPLLALAPIFSLLSSVLAGSNVTILEMAPGQGCILVAAFQVTTKDSNSTAELRVKALNSWPVCGHGSSNNITNGKHQVMKALTGNLMAGYERNVFVAYGGFAPFNDPQKSLLDFPICVIGPASLSVDNGTALVKAADQGIRMDGSYLWFSSDAVYNVSIPDFADPVSFPKYRECHPRGDRVHLDSAVFANNEDILRMLPNPYRDDIQSYGSYVGSDWANKTVTIQLPSVTSGPLVARRTAGASISPLPPQASGSPVPHYAKASRRSHASASSATATGTFV